MSVETVTTVTSETFKLVSFLSANHTDTDGWLERAACHGYRVWKVQVELLQVPATWLCKPGDRDRNDSPSS